MLYNSLVENLDSASPFALLLLIVLFFCSRVLCFVASQLIAWLTLLPGTH